MDDDVEHNERTAILITSIHTRFRKTKTLGFAPGPVVLHIYVVSAEFTLQM